MSIVNVWLEPSVALVGVDTDGLDAAGVRRNVGKLFPIPHAGCVLAGRGESRFLGCIAAALCNVGEDFDDLASSLKQLADQSVGEFRQMGAVPEGMRLELVLVGFSWMRNRMAGIELQLEPGAAQFVEEEIELEHVAPWHESLTGLPSPSSPANMAVLARAQARLLRSMGPNVAGGGKLIMASIERHQMRTWEEATL